MIVINSWLNDWIARCIR